MHHAASRYTPANQNAAHASGAGQRIVKMQDMPVDPLEPPKFRHTKVPRGPGSPPVPVMHSPPRPVTQEDQKNWKIPPAISNWKNAKVGANSGVQAGRVASWGARMGAGCVGRPGTSCLLGLWSACVNMCVRVCV